MFDLEPNNLTIDEIRDALEAEHINTHRMTDDELRQVYDDVASAMQDAYENILCEVVENVKAGRGAPSDHPVTVDGKLYYLLGDGKAIAADLIVNNDWEDEDEIDFE